MPSWKCPACGLVNFATASECKHCRALPGPGASQAPAPAGIVLADGYVLPPPPTGEIWRDGKTLVMTKDASLPDRCVKCNAPANGLWLKRNLSWHHPVVYLAIFLAFLVYIVLAAVLGKRATVYLGMCTEHFQRRRQMLTAGWILLAVGLIAPIVAFSFDYPAFGLLGILLTFVAIAWLVLAARVVVVKKIDDRLVWLNGINPDYLAQLPDWQNRK